MRLKTRNFFYRTGACSRRIFTERLPDSTAPDSRRLRMELAEMLHRLVGADRLTLSTTDPALGLLTHTVAKSISRPFDEAERGFPRTIGPSVAKGLRRVMVHDAAHTGERSSLPGADWSGVVVAGEHRQPGRWIYWQG